MPEVTRTAHLPCAPRDRMDVWEIDGCNEWFMPKEIETLLWGEPVYRWIKGHYTEITASTQWVAISPIWTDTPEGESIHLEAEGEDKEAAEAALKRLYRAYKRDNKKDYYRDKSFWEMWRRYPPQFIPKRVLEERRANPPREKWGKDYDGAYWFGLGGA